MGLREAAELRSLMLPVRGMRLQVLWSGGLVARQRNDAPEPIGDAAAHGCARQGQVSAVMVSGTQMVSMNPAMVTMSIRV